MPLGFQRLNERQQRPNANINFIKPIPGSPHYKVAQDFLERIAAQCYPVMKQHYISVMSLEEYPPNPEFLGRNFNAGEVIQLVLKDKGGRWLSFNFVQMVMMHELAHCKQMNHSRYFWKERNLYADAMKELWKHGYMGEGLWGRGQHLTNGEFVHDHMPDNADIPEHLCGGTYRRARGRKRKRGQQDAGEQPKVSYAERQQKRIAKKFGKHGEGAAVGEDELVRGGLERGKRHYGKPRVANSKRGRELRANAALARFEQVKKPREPPETTPELEDDDGSALEDWSDEDVDSPFAIASDDEDTVKIKDEYGHDMVRVCSDVSDEEGSAGREMDELRYMDTKSAQATDDSETESEPDDKTASCPDGQLSNGLNVVSAAMSEPVVTASDAQQPLNTASACPICSLENEPDSPTCMACAHVLKTSLVPNHWRCKREACKGSKYISAGDAGRCGLCGAQKPAVPPSVGTVSADVLRWD